jgi:hypothetical protein
MAKIGSRLFQSLCEPTAAFASGTSNEGAEGCDIGIVGLHIHTLRSRVERGNCAISVRPSVSQPVTSIFFFPP